MTAPDWLCKGARVWMDTSAWEEREVSTMAPRVVVSVEGALAELAHPDGTPAHSCHVQYLTLRSEVTR